MWTGPKLAMAGLLCGGLALGVSRAQEEPRQTTPGGGIQSVSARPRRNSDRTLTHEDRLAVLSAALDAKPRRSRAHDCSHLVHAIYERAGFSYAYADSNDLYAGVQGFQRVTHPAAGDLVVWQGHVGIVIRPSRHLFFSFLSAGPGTDDYKSPYWKSRGHARFYRYLKNDPCAGCRLVRNTSTPAK